MDIRPIRRAKLWKRRGCDLRWESSGCSQCRASLHRSPSCAGDGYDASSSAGSNKGPTNEEYLAEVETRIDTFLVHHPYLERKDVPAEMVTASGSGLDPDITPESAYVQVKRVAAARNMDETTVKEIVDQTIEKPFLGLFGTEKVNVLKLNINLENYENK